MGSSFRAQAFLQDEDGEYAELQELKRQLSEEARAVWNTPERDKWLAEQAAVITQTIYESFEHENVLQMMSTLQRNVGKFDRVTIREARGLRARWFARGGYIRASQMWQDVVELPRAIVGFHVYDETDKFEANFAESQGDLIELGTRRMDAAVNQYVFASFQAAVPPGDDFYASASGLNLVTLDTFLSEVFDVTEDENVVIAGRRPMVDQINTLLLDLAGNTSVYLPETNERLMQLGVLGKYRGATIMRIRNYRDELEVPFLPANELWVVGRDNSTSAFFGGLESKEFIEDDDWYWHYLAKREFGLMVHRKNRLRRIVDSNIQPGQGSGGSYADAA